MIPGVVEFSDPTVLEGEGNFALIKEIMEKDGPSQWMIRTNVTVVTQDIANNCILHLWDNGEAHIVDIDHPILVEAPDNDLRRLGEWARNSGWQLIVGKNLLVDQQSVLFWMRLYRAAVVHSDILQKKEEAEMQRMQSAYGRELAEDEVDNAY